MGHIRQLTSELTKNGNEWEANFTTAATRRFRIAAPLLNTLLTVRRPAQVRRGCAVRYEFL